MLAERTLKFQLPRLAMRGRQTPGLVAHGEGTFNFVWYLDNLLISYPGRALHESPSLGSAAVTLLTTLGTLQYWKKNNY